jgi:hypothetical protein
MRPEQLTMLANVLKQTQPLRSAGFEQRRPDRLRTDDAEPAKPAVDTSLAAKIIRAGERARTPDGYEVVTTDKTALAILAAGRKRRGEAP